MLVTDSPRGEGSRRQGEAGWACAAGWWPQSKTKSSAGVSPGKRPPSMAVRSHAGPFPRFHLPQGLAASKIQSLNHHRPRACPPPRTSCSTGRALTSDPGFREAAGTRAALQVRAASLHRAANVMPRNASPVSQEAQSHLGAPDAVHRHLCCECPEPQTWAPGGQQVMKSHCRAFVQRNPSLNDL